MSSALLTAAPNGYLPAGQSLTSSGMPDVLALPLRPEPEPPLPSTTAVDTPDTGWLDQLSTLQDFGPPWFWPAVTIGLLVASAVSLPLARRLAFQAGRRASGHTTGADRRDRALFLAALAPSSFMWVATLVGSGRGLLAFGRDVLNWRNGWDWLVPLTLDGVGVSFAFLAFRAIRKGRNPDRSISVAWSAMGASALINFGHEAGLVGGSALGGVYLGLLSAFAMLIFHELLDQFQQGTAWIKRDNPKFGMRWLTWPTNTACAWVAWRNYPPAPGTEATIATAVAHLDSVREMKRAKLAQRFTPSPAGWARVLPRLRVAQLDAALGAQRAEVEAERAERTEIAARLESVLARAAEAERLRTEQDGVLSANIAELQAERVAERRRAEDAERAASEAEQRAGALSEQVSALRAELRAERSRSAPKQRGKKAPEQPDPDPEQRPGAPRMSDAEAVALMLAEHPERSYEWTSREVHRLTGAGFGRIPKLLAMVAERHGKAAPERAGADDRSSTADASAERSA